MGRTVDGFLAQASLDKNEGAVKGKLLPSVF